MNTIVLHEVAEDQGISSDALTRQRMQRLNFFPDRPLGDDEFDRMQAYSDQRMGALEASLQLPGILDGLECRLHDHDAEDGKQLIQLFPGRGLGRNRELYALNSALEQEWSILAQRFAADPDTPDEPLNGLYLVVLDAEFFHMDIAPNQEPCQREELDRLRDARIQRGLKLSLASVDAALWDMPQVVQKPILAANRLLGDLVRNAALPEYAGISVALVGVENSQLLWLSASAGAFAATAAPFHQQLREHFYHSIETTIVQGVEAGKTALETMQTLEFAWLPAAAELPAFLLEQPERVNPRPALHWFPVGAQQALQVISESSLPVIMRKNLQRAPTGFDAVAGDRYRLGVVVSDENYRADLLQLPQIEQELVELLYRKARDAENAAVGSQAVWDDLASQFDAEANPEIAGVPERPAGAIDAQTVLGELAGKDWQAKAAHAVDMQAPYSNQWFAPPGDLPDLATVPQADKGLLAQYAEQIDRQEQLAEMIEEIDEILEMLENEKKQHRGLVDTLTIDLARVAGGIPGDGSGIKLAKAARRVSFSNKTE